MENDHVVSKQEVLDLLWRVWDDVDKGNVDFISTRSIHSNRIFIGIEDKSYFVELIKIPIYLSELC